MFLHSKEIGVVPFVGLISSVHRITVVWSKYLKVAVKVVKTSLLINTLNLLLWQLACAILLSCYVISSVMIEQRYGVYLLSISEFL